MRISLEALVMSNCVRYERLSQNIQEAFAGSDATVLNIYVDVYSIIRSLYSKKHITDISNYNDLTACIINLCAHYRDYFRKYLGVSTNIFLVASYNCCEMNKKLVSGYNKNINISMNSNRAMTELINYNFDLLNVLCPYLPDIHFIKTDYEASVVMYHIMELEKSKGNTNPNLIISKDPYMLQLVSLNGNTAYLRPRKHLGDDTSFIVGPLDSPDKINTFWRVFADLKVWKYDDIFIHPANISTVMALTAVPERDIKMILNVKKAKQIIASTGIIIPTLQTIYEQNDISNKSAFEMTNARYKAIDIQFQHSVFGDTVESKMIKINNLSDPNAVKLINDKYFENNPLDLERL